MEHYDDFDEGRFYCQKKDIKKEVRKLKKNLVINNSEEAIKYTLENLI